MAKVVKVPFWQLFILDAGSLLSDLSLSSDQIVDRKQISAGVGVSGIVYNGNIDSLRNMQFNSLPDINLHPPSHFVLGNACYD